MMSQSRKPRPSTGSANKRRARQEQGFTLIETTIALVVMMIVGLGAASLFFFAINYNTGANDRLLAMGVAQKQMEWLRDIPFSTATRNLALSAGGLADTGTSGVTQTVSNGGRQYSVVTIITDLNFDSDGNPTLKRITLRVTPLGAGTSLGAVTLTSVRATSVNGSNF